MALAALLRRWRHLIVFLVSLAVLEIMVPLLYTLAALATPCLA